MSLPPQTIEAIRNAAAMLPSPAAARNELPEMFPDVPFKDVRCNGNTFRVRVLTHAGPFEIVVSKKNPCPHGGCLPGETCRLAVH